MHSAPSPFSRFSFAFAAAVAALGLFSLAGWLLKIPALRAPIDAELPMKANAAVALVLLGIGLALAARDGERTLAPAALGGAVALLSLVTVAQDMTGWSFGLDEILSHDLSPAPGTVAPGRMSPVTAGALLLLATSLAALRWRGRMGRLFSPLLACASGLLAMGSLVGVAYGASELLSFGPFNASAPQASLGLLALSAGILALRTDVPPAAFWARTDHGAALARRFLPPAFVLPPVLGWIQIAGQRRGLWNAELGMAIVAFEVIAIATALVLWNATHFTRAEAVAREAEASRTALQEHYQHLFASINDPVILTTPDRRITDVNPAFESAFGYARDQAIGRSAEFLYANPEDFAAISEQLARGVPPRHAAIPGRRRDGSTFPTETSFFLMRSGGGEPSAGAVVRDVSEHQRLEEQFRQAQKMEAVGRLAGGVAHDFNNMLTAIIGYADLLQERLTDGEARADLDEIRRAADRAAALTKQLLAFSRKQVLRPAVLDLNAIVRESQGLIGRVIGEDVRLVLLLDPALPSVRADKGQIEQALMNLAVNARDAMPVGGTLTVATAPKTVDEASASGRPGLRAGRYVAFTVSDTGVGMTPDVHARLFEPFFTTKGRGKGTGLGLATTYGIVKQSDGYIWVGSELGHGSTFEILLPAVAGVPEGPEEPEEPAPVPRPMGGETILLVEDEEGVRKLVRSTLEASGYTILDAASGEEALDVFRAYQGPVHLLLTDVVMPGINGPELAKRIVGERPETRVLFISGYTDDALARNGALEPGTNLLEKPFSPADVANRVRAILDGA